MDSRLNRLRLAHARARTISARAGEECARARRTRVHARIMRARTRIFRARAHSSPARKYAYAREECVPAPEECARKRIMRARARRMRVRAHSSRLRTHSSGARAFSPFIPLTLPVFLGLLLASCCTGLPEDSSTPPRGSERSRGQPPPWRTGLAGPRAEAPPPWRTASRPSPRPALGGLAGPGPAQSPGRGHSQGSAMSSQDPTPAPQARGPPPRALPPTRRPDCPAPPRGFGKFVFHQAGLGLGGARQLVLLEPGGDRQEGTAVGYRGLPATRRVPGRDRGPRTAMAIPGAVPRGAGTCPGSRPVQSRTRPGRGPRRS